MFHSVSLLSQVPLARGSRALPSVLFQLHLNKLWKDRSNNFLHKKITLPLLAWSVQLKFPLGVSIAFFHFFAMIELYNCLVFLSAEIQECSSFLYISFVDLSTMRKALLNKLCPVR